MSIDRKKVMEQADKLVSSGQVLKAILEYRKVLREFPGDLTLLNRIGDLCVQAERFDDAAATFKTLALNLHTEGQEKKAIVLLKKVLKFAPSDLEASQQLVELLMATGASKEASQVHLQMARHFEQLSDLPRALDQLTLAVASDPSNLDQRLALAQRLAETGQRDKAAGHFLEAAEGLALAHRDALALQALDRAAALTDSPRLIQTRARVLTALGRAPEAMETLQKALANHPGNPVFMEALADLELHNGLPEEGLRRLMALRHPSDRILPLCEHAMHDLAKAGKLRLALRIFRPMAHQLAKRGMGTAVTACLKGAFRGHQHAVLWILHAEVALEADQQEEALLFLRQSYTMSMERPSGILRELIHRKIEEVQGQKKTIGQIITDQASQATMTVPVMSKSRLDPKAKLQLDQMEKDAHAQSQMGNHQGAIGLFQQILGMEPGRFTAMQGLVNVYKASGQGPKAQMQCIQGAQILALMGKKPEARLLLDIAEQQSPGSTRGPRQMLGL